jgi:hypothetical protein
MLFQFFAAYFHEDFLDEASTPSEVVSRFVNEGGPGFDLRKLSQEIVAYVDEHQDEKELGKALVAELGCYYAPMSQGISTRAWLLDVAAQLSRSVVVDGNSD